MTEILDVTGLKCPLPILRTKKKLKEVAMDGLLKVIATDPGSVQDMAAFCRQTGNELVETAEEGGTFTFLIKRKA
ncbi:MAG: sulfurtransferase TusA family protein [Rhodospirillaceae bacterium]|nr:sulfurtransferase TusA family protein [Rhodospirillales bacterium]